MDVHTLIGRDRQLFLDDMNAHRGVIDAAVAGLGY